MLDNCVNTTERFLTSLNIEYTKKYLKDCVLSHPDHPSLLSIFDTLKKYRIDTLAVKIDLDKLKDMPMPCVVQVEENNQHMFFVLQNISNKNVSYYGHGDKRIDIDLKDFSKQWTGVCLLVETNENSKEKDIEKKLFTRDLQNVLMSSIILLILVWGIFNFTASEVFNNVPLHLFYTIACILLKIIGLIVGVFLLWFEVDQYNPTLQNFCTGGAGSKINCNAVLNSKQAKLLNGTLSLSLLVFSYFFGSLACLMISGFSLNVLSILGWLSFISLPIIPISIYCQAVVIKQWCKFCIIIQAVLLAEIGVSFFSDFYKNTIGYETIPLLLALLLIPMLGWKLLRPLLEQEKEVNVHKRGLKKIKHNPDVLEGLLVKSRKIKTSTEGLGISLTNAEAKYHVIKVCNPYCGPCAKAHPALEDLVNAGKINLQILFTARSGEDRMRKPVSHFLAIDEKGDSPKTQQALDDWYLADQKDYEVFAKKYPMNGELKQQSKKIESMRAWCDAEHITHTPTIFINGHELPKEYSVEDLREVL
ncbi:cysteine peptidase family C39 domain-containing protein [Snuella lapsa]|uniref:Peptidase C39 domain-containing protein n=1 Tax=Snuella lapsa TaxID=870481 RepID=A0ABP6XE77_9FLAO